MPTFLIVAALFATHTIVLLIGVAFGRMVERANTIDALTRLGDRPTAKPDYVFSEAEQCAQRAAARQAIELPRGPMHTHFDL